MGHAAGDLSDGRQPLAALLPLAELGLVCVFDDGQVEIQEHVKRRTGGQQLVRFAGPDSLERFQQPAPQPRQRRVRINLREADLDVPQPAPPAGGGRARPR